MLRHRKGWLQFVCCQRDMPWPASLPWWRNKDLVTLMHNSAGRALYTCAAWLIQISWHLQVGPTQVAAAGPGRSSKAWC